MIWALLFSLSAMARGPVYLDARPPFEYALGHLPNATLIRWQDYSQTQDPHRGALDPDLSLLARKLRFLGINPKRDVIILGEGTKGKGEEGRIGWMLAYLGVKKVKLENIANVPGRKSLDQDDEAQNKSVPPWNPDPVSFLRAKMSDVQNVINKKDFVLIDVRDSDKFSAKHIPGAVNIRGRVLPAS